MPDAITCTRAFSGTDAQSKQDATTRVARLFPEVQKEPLLEDACSRWQRAARQKLDL